MIIKTILNSEDYKIIDFFICFANEKTRSRVIFTTAFAAQPTGTNGNIHGLFMFSNTLLNRLIHRDLD